MTQKNETPVLILSLLITAALLGVGGWWLASRMGQGGLSPRPNSSSSNSNGSPTANSSGSNVPAKERLSVGDRLLLSEAASPEKQAGIAAIAANDWTNAVANLNASLRANPNDPETLIYLNNAEIGDRPSYTIAVAVPTATAANSAAEILRGVAQAQQQVNQAGGINGVPLKVLIASDDNDPTTATAIATALVNDASVLGVVGHFGSDATLAAAPVYQQGGVVMVSPTSTSVQLSEQGDYIFRTVPSDRFTATALARYMLNSLQKRSAVVYFNADSAYSNSLKDEFATALATEGGQVLTEIDLSDSSFDAASTIKQAAQQNAEALVLLANTATLDQALQVVAVNRGQLPLLGGDSIYNPKTLQVGGAAAEGMVVAVPWVLLSNPQAKFVQESRRLWGGDVNWRTAMAYDAAQVLIAGLSQDPSRDGVDQALRSSNFSVNGATGTVRFLPSGDRNQPMQLVVVESGNRSGYGFDFVPVR
jgi:branched-chain amino acid transport system substrate-binding protein